METNRLKQRQCHTITPNKAQHAPKNVIFFDTETFEKNLSPTKRVLRLKLGVAMLTRRYPKSGYTIKQECTFTDKSTFHKWINKVCTGKELYYMVAHNIGFDIRVTGLMSYLTKAGWERKSFILDKINFMVRYSKGKTRIMLMNNQQMFNISLRQLGTSLGYDKLTVDFNTVSDDQLLTYCRRDTDIMRVAWNAWYKYIKTNDLGNFKITVGSQAFSAYRHRFMRHKIYIHNDKKVIDLERESYHGGRVECFFIGHYNAGKIYKLDINSMYPYIMSTQKIPTKLIKHYEQCPISVFEKYHQKYAYTAKAQVRISTPILPAVVNGRLVFQTGNVRGVFSKPELEFALKTGTMSNLSEVSFYDEKLIFKDFVDFFYKSRLQFKKEENKEFTYITKLLMNSLYGKFGQKITEYQAVAKNSKLPDHAGTTYDTTAGRLVKYRCIDGIIELEKGEHEANDSFVAIAASITAGARVYLAQLIEQAKWDNVLYCDTDSLFVTRTGYDNLKNTIDPNKLGYLKLEQVAEAITIHGNKRYTFGDSVVCKGLRKDAHQIAYNRYTQDQFQGFLGALRKGQLDGVVIDTVTKQLTDNYTKGTVLSNGRVIPFEVDA